MKQITSVSFEIFPRNINSIHGGKFCENYVHFIVVVVAISVCFIKVMYVCSKKIYDWWGKIFFTYSSFQRRTHCWPDLRPQKLEIFWFTSNILFYLLRSSFNTQNDKRVTGWPSTPRGKTHYWCWWVGGRNSYQKVLNITIFGLKNFIFLRLKTWNGPSEKIVFRKMRTKNVLKSY